MRIGKFYYLCWLTFLSHLTLAQHADIPDVIYFAGMKLNLSKGLRTDLLNQANALMRYKPSYEAKIKRADTYFPIIERVFEEEGIPNDFKYLVIQESSLQSDAVSSSQAVGFWQFKRESAVEMGLTINSEIDERKHIVESSRAAARYIKKNYLLLTNWVYALISYQTGFGGVKNIIEQKYIGASEMDLGTDTYWYAVKFLAHKLAFEDKVGYNHQPELSLLEYTKTKGKSLSKIASETEIAEDKLTEYNKWLTRGVVPVDKDYTVLLPVTYLERDQVAARLGLEINKKPNRNLAEVNDNKNDYKPKLNPKNTEKESYGAIPLFVTNNGLEAVIAREGDNVAKLAFLGKVSINRFRQYNDLQKFDEVRQGKMYYFEPKNSKGLVLFHTVKQGESLWDIAQEYGIKVSQLIKKNRIEDGEALQEGRLLYLRTKRPDREPILYAEKPVSVSSKPAVENKTPAPVVPKKDSLKSVKTENEMNTVDKTGVNLGKKESEDPANPPVFAVYGAVKKPAEISSDSAYAYHTVAQGQTLYSLSKYYNVKVDSIKVWNNIGPEGIKIGQTLVVNKERKCLNKNFLTYKVKNNQDLAAIAQEIGVNKENIVSWNDKKDQNVIPGELLKIKKVK